MLYVFGMEFFFVSLANLCHTTFAMNVDYNGKTQERGPIQIMQRMAIGLTLLTYIQFYTVHSEHEYVKCRAQDTGYTITLYDSVTVVFCFCSSRFVFAIFFFSFNLVIMFNVEHFLIKIHGPLSVVKSNLIPLLSHCSCKCFVSLPPYYFAGRWAKPLFYLTCYFFWIFVSLFFHCFLKILGIHCFVSFEKKKVTKREFKWKTNEKNEEENKMKATF